MTTQTTATPATLEAGILAGMEALTACPECQLLYSLGVYREYGRIVVVCPVCESGRDYADAITPPAAQEQPPQTAAVDASTNP